MSNRFGWLLSVITLLVTMTASAQDKKATPTASPPAAKAASKRAPPASKAIAAAGEVAPAADTPADPPAGSGAGCSDATLSLKDATVDATYAVGTGGTLTDIAEDMILAPSLKDPDPDKACALDDNDFKQLPQALANGTPQKIVAPKNTGCARYVSKSNAHTLRLLFVARCPGAISTATTNDKKSQEDPAPPADAPVSKCTSKQYEPLDPNSDELKPFGCSQIKDGALQLCLNASGEPIGVVPPLREGQTVVVVVIVNDGFDAPLTLDVTFERALVVNLPTDGFSKDLKSVTWLPKAQQKVTLYGKGTLKVVVNRSAGSQSAVDDKGTTSTCTLDANSVTKTFPVAGHYHFSAGLMVAYTRLQERGFSRQTGDDGVTRIGQQDSPGIDYVANVVAYPFGVDDDVDFADVGLVLGTSLGSLGKRWYGGLELDSPIGFGVSAGAAVAVVPRLDEPLIAGQPFSGDQLATHNAAEVTWYVGVNLQANLFKTVFGALFSSDDKKGGQ